MTMMGVLTSDLFIQLTTTLAHLSNMTLNSAEMGLGGEVDNETLAGRRTGHFNLGNFNLSVVTICVWCRRDQSTPSG